MEVIEGFDFSANNPAAGNGESILQHCGQHDTGSKIIMKDSAVSKATTVALAAAVPKATAVTKAITVPKATTVTKATAVTLGKFDGIHLGHRLLLKKIRQREELVPTVFTFSMGTSIPRLYTQQEKNQVLEGMGIAREVIFPFNDVTKRILPEQFIEEILMKRMDAKYICVGEDFRFGRNREGAVDTLIKYQDICGYELEIVEKLRDGEDIIGSTLIRRELEQGNLERVNKLLGAPYFICGEVLHGNALGRKMGLPTANLIPPQGKKLPPNGVYATTVEYNGGTWFGVTNIGRKPTVGKYDIGVETYIMDFAQDIYGQELLVRFHQFLRPEQRFDSVEELHGQIERDRERAYAYLSGICPPS